MDNSSYIKKYYNNLVEQYGDSYKSCDYGSKQSQEKKFKIFLDFFNNGSINALDLLDVGCGTGEFYSYIKQKFNDIKYEGIDLSDKMVNLCKSKHDVNLFKQANVLDYINQKDYIIANGIFYLICSHQEKNMRTLIRYMFSICRIGLAFNSLSSWAEKKEEREFYADPVKILKFCSQLTNKVVLRHDYLPHDFTIYMYK